MKKTFYSEAAYAIGLVMLAVGTAFMERASFGMSMIVAPAYILHLCISELLPFFSFGMATYTFQGLLLLCISLIERRFRPTYLFSFVTAVLFGLLLDGSVWVLSHLPYVIPARVAYYLLGMFLCAAGVTLMFRTYIPPEAYELFVKQLSKKTGLPIHKCKTLYDCGSCLLAVVLSFLFFGLWQFRGVNIGTVVCALINGTLVGWCGKWFKKRYAFTDRFGARAFFEGAAEEKAPQKAAD